jgi:hypothetical protein
LSLGSGQVSEIQYGAGITTRVWSIADVVALLDAVEKKAA